MTVISAIVMLGDAFSAKEGPLIRSASVDRVFPTQLESRENNGRKLCGIRTDLRGWWTGFRVTPWSKLRVCQRDKTRGFSGGDIRGHSRV